MHPWVNGVCCGVYHLFYNITLIHCSERVPCYLTLKSYATRKNKRVETSRCICSNGSDGRRGMFKRFDVILSRLLFRTLGIKRKIEKQIGHQKMQGTKKGKRHHPIRTPSKRQEGLVIEKWRGGGNKEHHPISVKNHGKNHTSKTIHAREERHTGQPLPRLILQRRRNYPSEREDSFKGSKQLCTFLSTKCWVRARIYSKSRSLESHFVILVSSIHAKGCLKIEIFPPKNLEKYGRF